MNGSFHDPDPRTWALLRTSATVYGLAIVVHFGDHLRRGVDASPRAVVALGLVAAALQATAVLAALARHALAPLLAVAVALPDSIGVVAVHLLPRWSGLSDSFPDGAPGVTAFSWVSAIAEVATGLVFAYAGWVALRRTRAVAANDS